MKEDEKFTQMLQEQQIVIYKICRMYAQDEHGVKHWYYSCSLALSLQDCPWKSLCSKGSPLSVAY